MPPPILADRSKGVGTGAASRVRQGVGRDGKEGGRRGRGGQVVQDRKGGEKMVKRKRGERNGD